LPTFLMQLSVSGNLARMEGRWFTQFLATPTVFAVGRNLAWRDSSIPLIAVVSLVSIACFWLPAAVGLFTLRGRPFAGSLLGIWALCPIAVPFVVALVFSPLYATRYAFIGLPPFLIIVSEGLLQFPPRSRGGLLALGLGLTCISLFSYMKGELKDNWRSETRYVLDRLAPGEIVVFDPDHEECTFIYYARRQGRVPQVMYGLWYRKGDDYLTGVRYDNGAKSDAFVRPLDSEIFDSRGVWLITCAPQRETEFYTIKLASGKFNCESEHVSHRIRVLHYVKEQSL